MKGPWRFIYLKCLIRTHVQYKGYYGGFWRRASSASSHKSRCPQMLVTAQNTNHIEDSLKVLWSRPESGRVVCVSAPLISVSVCSLCVEGCGLPSFRRRTTEISERQALARLRRQAVSSAEQNRSMRVSSAKIHRMWISVGVCAEVVLASPLLLASSDRRYRLNQCVKYMASWREKR